jgi:hypothetical protein
VESYLIEVKNMKIHLIQSESVMNLIQLKLMTVIDNMRNMMGHEFHDRNDF